MRRGQRGLLPSQGVATVQEILRRLRARRWALSHSREAGLGQAPARQGRERAIVSRVGKRGDCLPKRSELEVERFSVIMFSHFQRAKGMMKHGNYDGKWCDSYMSGIAMKA